jgi:two-component system, response regulator YesN
MKKEQLSLLGRKGFLFPMDILLVEDSDIFRKIIRHQLLEQFPSATIGEAGEAGEALGFVDSSPPKLIFMDIRLPGILGTALTETIKSLYPDIQIAILTHYDLPEYRETAFKSGADYYFIKADIPWEAILKLVEKICIH